MNDKAIEYETKLYQVSRVINNLKKIGINTTSYEEILETIKSECKKETDNGLRSEILSNAEVATSSMAVGYVEAGYVKAIGKLGKLLFELNKYEVYLRVASFSAVLREFIKNPEKSNDKLLEMRATLVKLLEDLKRSGTLSYEIEGHLVKDIYSLAYDFIKEEIIITGTSPTLHLLRADDIHKYNLDKYIVHEVEALDLKDIKYSRVLSRKNELDMDGVDASYLDEDLIKAIVSSTITSEYFEKKLESLDGKVHEYYNEIKYLDQNLSSNIEAEKEIKTDWKQLFGPVALLITSISITIGLFGGGFFLAKTAATGKKYKTEKTSYDTLTDEHKKEELYIATEDKKVFLKVNPYQETSSGFKRIVTSYDVSELEKIDSILDYLDLDFDALGIKGKDSEETKKTLAPEDLYDKMYYAIENYKIDESDFEYETDWALCAFGGFLIETIAIILYVLIEILFDYFFDTCNWSVLAALSDIIYAVRDIKESKDDIKTKKVKIKELQNKMKKLFIENKEIITKALGLLPELKTRPELQEKAAELETVLKRVRKIEVDNNLEK